MGRWKLTDDPPPKKKAPSSLEEGGRLDGGHKRKKEKELPQDSGSKKKVELQSPAPSVVCPAPLTPASLCLPTGQRCPRETP